MDDTLRPPAPGYIHAKDIPVVLLRRTALERLGIGLSRPEIASITGQTELIKVRDYEGLERLVIEHLLTGR